MYKILITILAASTIMDSVAVPNYWDPRNIISSASHDIFWYFGLSKEGIEQLRHYPRFRKQLLNQIDNRTNDFREYTQELTDQGNTDEAKLYREAVEVLTQAQQEAHDLLGVDGLGTKDTAELEAIIFAPTPEDVLQFNQEAKNQLAQLHVIMEGGSRFDEQVPVIVATEEQYKKLSLFLKKVSKQKKLSPKEKNLIKRAQASLDFAYHFIPISAGHPGDGDRSFFDNLANQQADKLFILYPHEPEEERNKYLDARLKQLRSSVTHSFGGGLALDEVRVIAEESISKKYESLKT